MYSVYLDAKSYPWSLAEPPTTRTYCVYLDTSNLNPAPNTAVSNFIFKAPLQLHFHSLAQREGLTCVTKPRFKFCWCVKR